MNHEFGLALEYDCMFFFCFYDDCMLLSSVFNLSFSKMLIGSIYILIFKNLHINTCILM